MKKYWIPIAAVAGATLFFFLGVNYGRESVVQTPNAGRGTDSPSRIFGGRGGNGGGFAAGNIVSKDGQSITVQLPNGNSEIVFYSISTQIVKPSPASLDDLKTGTQVMIGGIQNPDGSLTAQSIQIRNGNASDTNGARGQ